jgi:hypothetical protein
MSTPKKKIDHVRLPLRFLKVIMFAPSDQARNVRLRTLHRKQQVSLAPTIKEEAEEWLEWMETEFFTRF